MLHHHDSVCIIALRLKNYTFLIILKASLITMDFQLVTYRCEERSVWKYF